MGPLTDRQRLCLRAALSYAISNLDDVNEAFEFGEYQQPDLPAPAPSAVLESELDELLAYLQ